MDEIIALLAGKSSAIELDRAALLLATIEYPGLSADPFLALLDSHARELGERVSPGAGGAEFLAAANHYLFDELGFKGNQDDYYDPRNSCLNEVLARRTGIPITLSVVYLEIARRLGRPIYGVGLPGHFLVQYDDGAYSTFLDPFHSGALLTPAECFRLAEQVTGAAVADPQALARVDARHIVTRMIQNLRGIYFARRAYPKALQIMDLLVAAHPGAAANYKQRGAVYMQTQQPGAARADFERYLALEPEAADRSEIQQHIRSLQRFMAGMN